jgi:glucose/arabinose dehydrogenase
MPLDATEDRIATLKVAPGAKIEKVIEGLKTPRVIMTGLTLYVSSRDEGTISMVPLSGGKPGTVKTVLTKPNVDGMSIRDERLFYITIREIFSAPIQPIRSLRLEKRIVGELPDAGQHPNLTRAFGPDGLLYVGIGSTCNDCEENNPESARLLRMQPDGTGREIVASGFRNTIGFAWQPGTGTLYGLDNGVDAFGDNEQPEELTRIEAGKKGWLAVYPRRRIEASAARAQDGHAGGLGPCCTRYLK